MVETLAFFGSPMQIGLVLIIALVIFGPKKLPEIGRQIGAALRDLRKAADDLTRSFNSDHEPETSSYAFNDSSTYGRVESYYTPPAAEAPDLTDYTIAGVTPMGVLSPEGERSNPDPGLVVGTPPAEAASPAVDPVTAPEAGSGATTV